MKRRERRYSARRLLFVVFLIGLFMAIPATAQAADTSISAPGVASNEVQLSGPWIASSAPIGAQAVVDQGSSTWRILVIIFEETDTDYTGQDGEVHHLSASMTDEDISDVMTSLEKAAGLVNDWSAGMAQWDVDVEFASRPLTRMSAPYANHQQWVDPDSVRDVLDEHAPDGAYDQVMVCWKANDDSVYIPTMGWGLTMGCSPWGYSTVFPIAGFDLSHVWIHEWLHSVCWFYESKGFAMPTQWLDDAGAVGYTQNMRGMEGFGAFYSDLMQAKVPQDGVLVGITAAAWLSGSPRQEAIPPSPPASYTGWKGEYFSNTDLNGTPTGYRDDQAIDFDWGLGRPMNGLPADSFSVRWTRTLDFDGGQYRFSSLTDDGVRVLVDGRVIIEAWVPQDHIQHSTTIPLTSGRHTVVMEYYEAFNFAAARLWWENVTYTTTSPFTDTSASPYRDAIESLAGAGIISGYPDGTFRPDEPVMRQQFAKMIDRAVGIPVDPESVCPFPDVPSGLDADDPLYPDKYVGAAAGLGLIRGFSDGTFVPYGNVTRAQVVSMVVRAAQSLNPGLLQTPLSAYRSTWGDFDGAHGGNARTAQYNGLLPDSIADAGVPFGDMARGEVAEILCNYLYMIERDPVPTPGPGDITAEEIAALALGESPNIDARHLVLSDYRTFGEWAVAGIWGRRIQSAALVAHKVAGVWTVVTIGSSIDLEPLESMGAPVEVVDYLR